MDVFFIVRKEQRGAHAQPSRSSFLLAGNRRIRWIKHFNDLQETFGRTASARVRTGQSGWIQMANGKRQTANGKRKLQQQRKS